MVTAAALDFTLDRAPFAEIYPFASHFHPTPSGRLHYVDEGQGRPILMLHGNPTWSFYYRELIRALRATHRVIAPDHLGSGLSDRPADGAFSYRLGAHIDNVESLILALDLHEITLVVHDWGGAIGMGLAERHPARFRSFVVMNTAAFPSKRIPPSIDVCRIPGFGALMIRGLGAFSKVALLRAVHHKERLTPAVRAGYLAPYASWEHRRASLRFVQDIPMRPEHPSYPLLAEIGDRLSEFQDHPMLIVWGAKDFCFDEPFYAEWRRRFPRAEAHWVEDASHWVVEDAHERIVSWMRAWLGEG
jgi:haloalkane dehalogenase